MTKTKKVDAKVKVNETGKVAEAVEKEAKEPIEVKDGVVEVAVTESMTFYVGPKKYIFEKDKKYKVSQNVMNVLKGSGKLKITY